MKTRDTRARVLTLSFAATTAMWVCSYISLLFAGPVGGEVLFVLAGLSLVVSGVICVRHGGSDLQCVGIGGTSALLNVLLLGSLVGGVESEAMLSKGALWFGILLIGSIGLACTGGQIGRKLRPSFEEVDWRYRFFTVTAILVFLMLVTGGLVTGLEAGLAVPDWPNSYGYNMLLYPLTEMVSPENEGVFFEHAHRLTGMFVGLASMVMLVCAWRWSTKPAIWFVAICIFVMVCMQGVLGGLRVTGYLTLSQDPMDLKPNLWIGIVHGVVGQLIFAGFVWITAMMSPTWNSASAERDTNAKDVRWGWALVCTMVLQLILGAVYRHMLGDEQLAPRATHVLYTHITLALVVLVAAVVLGLRFRLRNNNVLRTYGALLLGLVGVQLVLGGGALISILVRSGTDIPAYEVVFTTLHQANGALLLGASVASLAWARRCCGV